MKIENKPVSVAQLAKELGLNRAYLRRLIKQEKIPTNVAQTLPALYAGGQKRIIIDTEKLAEWQKAQSQILQKPSYASSAASELKEIKKDLLKTLAPHIAYDTLTGKQKIQIAKDHKLPRLQDYIKAKAEAKTTWPESTQLVKDFLKTIQEGRRPLERK